MRHVSNIFLYTGISLLGGFAVWPIIELIIANQGTLPSVLMYNIIVGALAGCFIGAFIGSIKGLRLKQRGILVKGALLGAASGTIGGVLGMIAAQGVLSFTGSVLYYSSRQLYLFGVPFSRTIGWGLLGAFVGITEGIRAGNWYRIRNGLLGGLAGGVAGGFFSELLHKTGISGLQRLSGFLLLGAGIGFLYSLIDNQFSKGYLTALNGRAEGKTFQVYKKTIIGDADNVDVTLLEDSPQQSFATIVHTKEGFSFSKIQGNGTLINDEPALGKQLADGDVVSVGKTKFLFQVK